MAKKFKKRIVSTNKHSRLCENHFTKESFDESYAIKLSLGLKPGKPQLNKNAVPTIFNFANVGRDKKRRGTGQNESELSAFAKRRKLEVRQGFVSLLMLSLNTYRSKKKRFLEVFGNARRLIFYLSTKAWEEKSLPKSYLGCFYIVFGEGKATRENISIFWFI